MKQIKNFPPLINFSLLICLALALLSCDKYHFTDPQPIDAENIYEFPKILRGTWVKDGDTITIGKDYYKNSHQETVKIINGIWTNPADTMIVHQSDSVANKKRSALKRFESLKTIKYDSLKNPIDTITNYIIQRKRIYNIEHEKSQKPGFSQGYPFSIKSDTIFCQVAEAMEFSLGRNTFLRKVSTNRYILNVREGTTLDSQKQWWSIFLLEKPNAKTILVKALGEAFKDNANAVYSDQAQDDDAHNYYFDSQWTKKELVKLIDDGLFADTVLNLDVQKKIKVK